MTLSPPDDEAAPTPPLPSGAPVAPIPSAVSGLSAPPDGGPPGALETPLELGAALRILYERGRAAWSELDLSFEHFADHVRRHLADEKDPVMAALSLNGPDLYLACACLRLVPGAIDAFEERYLRHLPALLAGNPDTLPLLDDVGQILREKLLVGTAESQPKIAQYKGHGALLRWLQAVAVRTALKLLPTRAEAIAQKDEQRLLEFLATDDPEVDYIKDRYGNEVKQSFEAAFKKLKFDQRVLLRGRLLDGLSIDELAIVAQCDRSTAARRVNRALDTLLDEVKRDLHERLGLSPAELKSLILLVRSRLDLSLSRLLSDKKKDSDKKDG